MNQSPKRQIVLAAILILAGFTGRLSASDAEAILEATGKVGGICIVSGEKDIAFVESLAAKSNFFIQVLQPESKQALAWSGKIGSGELREKISVCDSEFNPTHYASSLLNLVVMQKPPGDKIKDVIRILAPGGVLALRGPAEDLSASGLKKLTGPPSWTLLRKPTGAANDWAPTDTLRWRSGARYHQIQYSDFPTVAFGNGKLIYRESMANRGGGARFELLCRDAYNGRVLWRIEEEPFTGKDWSGYLRHRLGLAITESGKVYTGLGKEFVCLDAETGKVLSKLGPRPNGGIRIHKAKYLVAGGGFYDLDGFKKMGTYGGGRTSIVGDAVYVMGGRNFSAYQIPDGKVLWKADVTKGQPAGQLSGFFTSEKAIHVTRIWPSSVTAMDLKTGAVLWSFPKSPQKSNSRNYWAFGDKILAPAWDLKTKISEPHDFVVTMLDAATGKVVRDHIYPKGKHWSGGCWAPRKAGDYLVYHHNVWFNLKTEVRTSNLLLMAKCAQGPQPSGGLLYAFPGRKGGAVKGVVALAPHDLEFGNDPGGKVLRKLGPAVVGEKVAPTDWPMYRGNALRGNAAPSSLGTKLTKKWEVPVGLGGQTYGRMDAERTGLTQPTSAWGTVFVSDLDGGRVVALNANDGKLKWSFHVGHRVSFSPTLYQGLCLFGTKDGWVYGLNAKTGEPVYKLLIAPSERYIGGQEKLESMWPVCGDIFVNGGVAYASAGLAASIHGGVRVVAFDPASGRVLWSKCIQGSPTRNEREAPPGLFVLNEKRKLIHMGFTALHPETGEQVRAHADKGLLRGTLMEDWLSTNNLSRLSEDMGGAGLSDGRIHGRLIAFNKSFGVGFSVARAPKRVHHVGTITLAGKSIDGKTKWAHPTQRLNIDDLLLTPDRAYCVGHYEENSKPAELREISLKDGSIAATHEINGFPVYNGMAVAGKKLFLATREGKLICFEGQ